MKPAKTRGFSLIEVIIIICIIVICLGLCVLIILIGVNQPQATTIPTNNKYVVNTGGGVNLYIAKTVLDKHEYFVSHYGSIVHSASCPEHR